MAVASVEENVKLKDLWQAKYTVAMLKSMKTVTFETPSGNHAYTVVMVVYSTQGVCGVYDPAFVLVCCCGLCMWGCGCVGMDDGLFITRD